MGGKCETCLKKDGCTKIIGAMFGFCNTDYEEEFIEKTGMTYKDIVNKYFDAWVVTGNIDEGYADSGNIMEWLQDRDLWTEEDEMLLSGMTMEELSDFADDIADMVKENIL